MARTTMLAIGLAILGGTAVTAFADDDTQTFSFSRTEDWVVATLDTSNNLQRDGDGKVIGDARQWTWRATYNINHTTDVIQIGQTFEFDPASGSAAVSNAELGDWESKMERFWDQTGSDWRIRCTDTATGMTVDYQIAYDATLWREGEGPDSGLTAMYDITITDGNGRSNAGNWYRGDANKPDPLVVEHETGHYVGLPDEYYDFGGWIDPDAPDAHLDRAFQGDGIMNNTDATTGAKLHDRYFYAWIQGLLAADSARGIDASTRSYRAVMIPAPAGSIMLGLAGLVAARRRRQAA